MTDTHSYCDPHEPSDVLNEARLLHVISERISKDTRTRAMVRGPYKGASPEQTGRRYCLLRPLPPGAIDAAN